MDEDLLFIIDDISPPEPEKPCSSNCSIEEPESNEITKFYSGMTDKMLLAHIKTILDELPNRPNLQTDEKSSPSDNKSNEPSSNNTCDSGMKEPKQELTDEQLLVMHENSTGLQYNRNGNYSWNPSPIGETSLDSTIAKQLNELNGYGIQCNVTGKKAATLKLSEKYWDRKGGDPRVDCKCSICAKSFQSLRILLDHRLLAHSLKAMLTCGFCGKVCLKRTHIFLHLSQEYKVFHCDQCDVSFSSSYHLDKHNCRGNAKKRRAEIKQMSPEAIDQSDCSGQESVEQSLDCESCGKHYTNLYWLEKHKEKCAGKKVQSGEDSKESKMFCQKCPTCNRVYNSQFWFEKHTEKCVIRAAEVELSKTTSPEPPKREPPTKQAKSFPCPHCDTSFPSHYWLTHHISRCIVRQSRIDISDGPTTSNGLTDTDMPLLVDSSLPPYRNNPLNDAFDPDPQAEPLDLEAEMKSSEERQQENNANSDHLEAQIPPTKCSICKTTFTNISRMLFHRKSAHGTAAMLTCGVCGKQCNSLSTIRRHMCQCPKCDRKCVDRVSLRRHNCDPKFRNRNSPTRTNHSIECPKCGESFPNATLLYSHRMKCGPLICLQNDDRMPTCSSSFTRQSLELVKEEEREDPSCETGNDAHCQQPLMFKKTVISIPTRLECHQCLEAFSLRSDLSRHRKEAHGKEAFQCSFCPKIFTNYRALHDHHMIEIQKFKCGQCGKLFGRKYMLEFHEGFCGRK